MINLRSGGRRQAAGALHPDPERGRPRHPWRRVAAIACALDARLAAARSLMQAARLPEAEGRAILESARVLGEDGAVTRARAMDVVAECLWRSGKTRDKETTRLLEESARLKEAALGQEDPEFATTLGLQASVRLASDADLAAVKALLERALAIQRGALGPDHAEVGTTLHILGMVLGGLGDYAGAIRVLTRAVAIREKALGPDHPDLAKSLTNLGSALFRAGRPRGSSPRSRGRSPSPRRPTAPSTRPSSSRSMPSA